MESLNFYESDIDCYDMKDIVLLAKNCSEPLISLNLNDYDLRDLLTLFCYAVKLEEFGGAPSYKSDTTISYMRRNDFPIVVDLAQQLMKLDLMCSMSDDINFGGFLAYECPNLEVLYTKGVVSQIGLSALARGCVKLECLHAYIKDITNEALECIESNLKNLYDFRITSVDTREKMTDLPLDKGVRALLMGCTKLEKLGIYIRNNVPLTAVSLWSIGKFGQNLMSLMLGYLDASNDGLMQLSAGCPKLQKFEVRGCYFSEEAISMLALNLSSIRYMWFQSYRVGDAICKTKMDFIESKGDIFGGDGNIRNMFRPNWHMELIRPELDVDVNENTNFQILLINQHFNGP
ncbi:coronatine-insensitive protein 1-like [Rutidosis leptorrhynchoides]|uniref:coronatine-insensitive protein 1-like n=1 Tax=Rutidosis leptorrhynchoides TaxID=125765 RepID=UPI003A9A4220